MMDQVLLKHQLDKGTRALKHKESGINYSCPHTQPVLQSKIVTEYLELYCSHLLICYLLDSKKHETEPDSVVFFLSAIK